MSPSRLTLTIDKANKENYSLGGEQKPPTSEYTVQGCKKQRGDSIKLWNSLDGSSASTTARVRENKRYEETQVSQDFSQSSQPDITSPGMLKNGSVFSKHTVEAI